MHFQIRFHLLGVVYSAALQLKAGTGILSVCIHCKGCQRKKIDSVTVLQNVKISVTGADANHIGNAPSLPCCRPHPQDIMVSPLNIHGMMGHQLIHNQMRPRSPIVNISQNMQMIHNQPLNQAAESNDTLLHPAYPDNGLNNGIVIGFLIRHIDLFRNQLFNHIGKFRRQSLSHLGPGIFAGRLLADFDQAVHGNPVPVLPIGNLLQNLIHFLSGIINQGCQLLLVFHTQSIPENLIDLAADGTGAVFHYMGKRFVFSVNIRQKVLRSLGKIQNSLQVNHLCRCLCNRGIQIRKPFQISDI